MRFLSLLAHASWLVLIAACGSDIGKVLDAGVKPPHWVQPGSDAGVVTVATGDAGALERPDASVPSSSSLVEAWKASLERPSDMHDELLAETTLFLQVMQQIVRTLPPGRAPPLAGTLTLSESEAPKFFATPGDVLTVRFANGIDVGYSWTALELVDWTESPEKLLSESHRIVFSLSRPDGTRLAIRSQTILSQTETEANGTGVLMDGPEEWTFFEKKRLEPTSSENSQRTEGTLDRKGSVTRSDWSLDFEETNSTTEQDEKQASPSTVSAQWKESYSVTLQGNEYVMPDGTFAEQTVNGVASSFQQRGNVALNGLRVGGFRDETQDGNGGVLHSLFIELGSESTLLSTNWVVSP